MGGVNEIENKAFEMKVMLAGNVKHQKSESRPELFEGKPERQQIEQNQWAEK